MGKGENNGYFGNCCRLRPESCLMQTTNGVNEGKLLMKAKVIS